MADLEHHTSSNRPGHSTGPRTSSGKAVSSQNSTKHGCCSSKIIIKGESEAELNELLADWLREYAPESSAERSFIEQAVQAQWSLKRNTNRYNDLEKSLEDKSVLEWTEEDHKQIERFTRYRITAERSFARAFNNLEQVRKYWQGREQALEEPEEVSNPESPDEESETGVEPIQEPKEKFIHVLEQWVDVVIENGKTVTKLEPSNDQLLADLKALRPPPEQVCRRFHFRDGIPDEYSWCFEVDDEGLSREYGWQRMTIDTWLAAIKLEKSGHLTDTGSDEPEPRKGLWCYCEVCRRNIGIRERRMKELDA